MSFMWYALFRLFLALFPMWACGLMVLFLIIKEKIHELRKNSK